VAVAAACTPRDVAVGLCRDPERPVIEVPDNHTVPWPSPSLFITNGTTIEAAGQRWIHDEPSASGHRIGVKFHRPDEGGVERMDVCFVGGDLYTTMHPETTPWSVWHDTYAFVQENRNATVVGVRLFNTGDGIAFTHRAHDWRVVGVRADGRGVFEGAYIHDDCIENDGMFEGLIVDSKFDGCNTFLSANTGALFEVPPDGTGRTVRIERTLVRHFGLDDATAGELMRLAEAERAQSLDHFQFTRLIAAEYDLGQKMVLAEVMWGVILADGKLSDRETHLVRKLANLMDLAPAYLAQARRAAAGEK
jgi:uncharacterized tellurite resistance protein B-like protein